MSESEIYVGIFGTGVGRASVKQLERHWDRDLSIISRLNSTYTPDRDILAQQLRRECNETVTL